MSDIEKPEVICSPSIFVNDFPELIFHPFIHPSINQDLNKQQMVFSGIFDMD